MAKQKPLVSAKLTQQAADALAFFVDDPFYGDGEADLSKIIVAHFEEWANRENIDIDELHDRAAGEYQRHFGT